MHQCLRLNRDKISDPCRNEELKLAAIEYRDIRLRPKLNKLCSEEKAVYCKVGQGHPLPATSTLLACATALMYCYKHTTGCPAMSTLLTCATATPCPTAHLHMLSPLPGVKFNVSLLLALCTRRTRSPGRPAWSSA